MLHDLANYITAITGQVQIAEIIAKDDNNMRVINHLKKSQLSILNTKLYLKQIRLAMDPEYLLRAHKLNLSQILATELIQSDVACTVRGDQNCLVLSDTVILQGVLINIYANAIEKSAKSLDLNISDLGNMVSLIIQNNGEPMPGIIKEKLFHEKISANINHQGTGKLFTSYRLLKEIDERHEFSLIEKPDAEFTVGIQLILPKAT